LLFRSLKSKDKSSHIMPERLAQVDISAGNICRLHSRNGKKVRLSAQELPA
jgi:hypothetical protein